MNNINKVFIRELGRIRSDRSLRFMLLIGPLISFFLIISIFYKGVPNDLPVAVVDNDNSTLSNKIESWVDATSIAKVAYRIKDLKDAEILMEKGKIDAIVMLPNNLERDVVKGISPEIPVFFNNSNIVKGGLLYKGIFTCLSTIKAGLKMQVRTKKGYSQMQLMPSVLPIRYDVHLLYNPYLSYVYFVGTAVLAIMLIVFTLLSCVYSLGSEIRYGTSKNLLDSTDGSISSVVIGKMLPYTFVFTIFALVIDLILFVVLDVPLNGSLLTIIISQILLVITYQACAIILIALTANLRLSISFGAAYTMMALSFSGLTYPAVGMPAIAKIFTLFFPFTYYLEIFISQSLKDIDLHIALYNLLPQFVFILIAIPLVKRIKVLYSNSKYWGKI